MTEAARSLATEEGLARFVQILNAISLWRDELTRVQRRVLLAGGGACAQITETKLSALHLVHRVDAQLVLTDLGRFVVECNRPKDGN